ncbi:hypothetical protein ACE38V_21815 [Cytobacillus sp. Hz8]
MLRIKRMLKDQGVYTVFNYLNGKTTLYFNSTYSTAREWMA